MASMKRNTPDSLAAGWSSHAEEQIPNLQGSAGSVQNPTCSVRQKRQGKNFITKAENLVQNAFMKDLIETMMPIH